MLVYIIMLIISTTCTYFYTKVNNKIGKIALQIFAMLPFIIVSAIRYDVGTDYFYRYVPNYNTFAQGGVEKSLEPLFVLLIRACILISKDPTVLFVITSMIINTIIMIAIFRYSKNPVVSVLIYFVGSFYFESMNIVRQFIGMAILFAGYRIILLDSKKKYIYLACVLVATLFHTMCLVFAVALFLDKKVIRFKHLLIIILLILILGGFLGDLVEFVINNTPLNNITNINKYIKYFKTAGDLHLSAIIVEAGVYAFIYYMYKLGKESNKEVSKETIFFVNMQTIAVICTIMNVHFELFFRATLMFSIFQLLSIPYFWYINKEKKIQIGKYAINTSVLTVVIICLLTSRLIYSNVIKQIEEVVPYKTIFEIDK